jgi:hypothetical protein
VKLININRYQLAKITNELNSRREGDSKPFRKTPKLGNSQAAKLASTAAMEITDGFKKAFGGSAIFMFAGRAIGESPVAYAI